MLFFMDLFVGQLRVSAECFQTPNDDFMFYLLCENASFLEYNTWLLFLKELEITPYFFQMSLICKTLMTFECFQD